MTAIYDSKEILSGESEEFPVSMANPVASKNIVLGAAQSAAGSGSFALEISIASDSGIVKCNTSKNSSYISVSDGKVSLTSGELASKADKIDFSFYDNSNNLLYKFTETINIFDNLITNTWVQNGSDPWFVTTTDANGKKITTCRITAAMVEGYALTDIYVDSGRQATNPSATSTYTTASGTWLNPVTSFADAIAKLHDSTKDYTIYIKGELRGAQTIPSDLSKNASDTKPYHARTLTICGATGLDDSGLPQDTIDGDGTLDALTINTTVPVTIQKLKIRGGDRRGVKNQSVLTLENCEITNNGEGFFSDNDFTIKNCKISNNTKGGVYICPCTALIIDSEISHNSTSSWGGGIGIEDKGSEEGSVEIRDCTISYNSASYGGAIYNFNSPLKIHNTIIENNTAEGTDMNGGGLYLCEEPVDGIVELTGSTIIRNNSCTDGGIGGAIYSIEIPVYIKDSVYIPSGTDNTNDVFFTDAKFVINGSLTLPAEAGGIAASITPYYHIEGTQVLDASNTTLLESEYNKFVVNKPSPNSELLFIGNDGKLFSPVTFDNGTYLTGTGSSVLYEGNYYRVANYSFLTYDKMTMSVANPYGAGLSLTTTVDSEVPVSGAISASELSDGYHTIVTTLTKPDGSTESGTKRVLVKIKPVKVTIGTIEVYFDTNGEGSHSTGQAYISGDGYAAHEMYIEGDAYPDEAGKKKTCRTVVDNSNDGRTGNSDNAVTYRYNTDTTKNYVYLTEKSSKFYFYTNRAHCTYMNIDLCQINKNDDSTTRTLSKLKTISNRHFATGDVNWAGNHVSGGGCPRGYYSFDVTPSED